MSVLSEWLLYARSTPFGSEDFSINLPVHKAEKKTPIHCRNRSCAEIFLVTTLVCIFCAVSLGVCQIILHRLYTYSTLLYTNVQSKLI